MSSNWWCDFVAGWIGGSAGIVVGHPADTVKVVQQVFMMWECMMQECMYLTDNAS